MRFRKPPTVAYALLLALCSAGQLLAQAPKTDRAIEFTDLAGVKHKPLAVPDAKATVLFFLMPGCPNSNAYAPEIKRICDNYEPKKVAAFVVHADPDVSVADARKHAKEYGLTCPVLLDPYQRLVEFTGVTTAPEAAVLSPEGKVLYKGRIVDLFVDFGKRRPEPTQRDLREALDAILAGKEVKTPTTKAIGCPLPEPKK
jgi:thiol-disulfide isomerase/thioredoxin